MNAIRRTLPLAALMAASVFAQGPGPFGRLTAGRPPDPATMIQDRVARLTTALSLTASQAAQATTIFTAAQSSITTLQTTLDGYRTSMQTAVKSNATATIDSIAASIGTTSGQITAIQNKADAAFYALLTSDQQTKLASVRGGFGGPGGRGPRP